MPTRFCEACESTFDDPRPIHAAVHGTDPRVYDPHACAIHAPPVRCPHCGAWVPHAEDEEAEHPRLPAR